MEFSQLVRSRRSIHHFTDDEVTEEELTSVLKAARWAPSAGNTQPWRFIVVRRPENREKVWESKTGIVDITPQNFIKKAPVHVIVCTDTEAYKRKQARIRADLYSIQDSAAAAMTLLLAAADVELGACWVGMFREEALREAFNIPSSVIPVAIIPVGHTRSKESPRPRKVLDELVYHETWSS